MPALTKTVFDRDLVAHGWRRRPNGNRPYWAPEELTRGLERVRIVPMSRRNGPLGMFRVEYAAPGALQDRIVQATAKPWINKYSGTVMPARIDIHLPASRWSPPERNLHLWLISEYFSK